MKIALGSDHAGFAYKEKAKALLLSLGHEVKDCGTSSDAPVPYPQYIRPAAHPRRARFPATPSVPTPVARSPRPPRSDLRPARREGEYGS
jgi:hypothetical protein